MRIELTPYQPSYDGAIASLEDSSVQGKAIQLKIIKNHFLDRSAVFQHSFPCIALTDDDKVIATAVGAQTKMVINKESIKAGFVFDAKVHLSYRRNGVGMRLARHQKDWFSKQGFEKNFTTLKLSNAPVIKVDMVLTQSAYTLLCLSEKTWYIPVDSSSSCSETVPY